MKKVLVFVACLLLNVSAGFAQSTEVSASYEAPMESGADWYQPIGCQLVASGHGNELSAYISIRWESANISGENTWTEYSTDYIARNFMTEVPVSADDMRVTCNVQVTFSGWANTVQQRSSTNTAPGRPPYVTANPDAGNQWTGVGWRRDIWYQVWHANSTRWNRGGDLFETWTDVRNPCALEVVKGVGGSVNSAGQFLDTYAYDVEEIGDPACVYEGDQSYALSTAACLTIHRQGWRFDTTGIYRR